MTTQAITKQQSALLDQVYNHPNWQSNPSAQDIERLLKTEGRQFVVTSDVCNPQESQKSIRFVIYFLNEQDKVKHGHVSLDPENPGKWFHKNYANLSTRNIGKVFQHVIDFRNCPQYAEAKFE